MVVKNERQDNREVALGEGVLLERKVSSDEFYYHHKTFYSLLTIELVFHFFVFFLHCK